MNQLFDTSNRTGEAVLSDCGKYRFLLSRHWGGYTIYEDGFDHTVNFVMLNPSTADAHDDDPTIRRCIRFAKSWGYNGLTVTNLYPLRAKDPAKLETAASPRGPLDQFGLSRNNSYLVSEATRSPLVVCAWGAGADPGWAAEVVLTLRKLKPLMALRLTKAGYPCHPLRLPANLTPILFAELST